MICKKSHTYHHNASLGKTEGFKVLAALVALVVGELLALPQQGTLRAFVTLKAVASARV